VVEQIRDHFSLWPKYLFLHSERENYYPFSLVNDLMMTGQFPPNTHETVDSSLDALEKRSLHYLTPFFLEMISKNAATTVPILEKYTEQCFFLKEKLHFDLDGHSPRPLITQLGSSDFPTPFYLSLQRHPVPTPLMTLPFLFLYIPPSACDGELHTICFIRSQLYIDFRQCPLDHRDDSLLSLPGVFDLMLQSLGSINAAFDIRHALFFLSVRVGVLVGVGVGVDVGIGVRVHVGVHVRVRR
jgi:hypothetical protein